LLTVPVFRINPYNLFYYAFTGAEALPKLAGETIDVKNIPKAINKSISITTILYVLVAIVMISLNINSDTPMVSSYMSIFGPKSKAIISVIALFSIFNTIMTNNISSSRTLYGYGLSQNIKPLTYIGKNKTPILAIIIVCLLSITMLYMDNMKNLAIFSNIFIMITMMIINIVAYKEKKKYRNIISIIGALMFILYGSKHLIFN
jgi:APA family basic amino acid/polyamine antiporter